MKGLVTEEKKDLLTVHIIRQEACGHCKGCFSGYMEADLDIEAKNLCDAEVGDWVEIQLQDNAFLKAVMISYGIPFLGFVVGLLLGNFVLAPMIPSVSDALVSCASALLVMFVCFGWIKSQNPRWESGHYLPMATKLTTEGYYE